MARRPFPVDATLTAISIGYRNPSHTLIARRVLPPLQVLSEQFKWMKYPLEQGFRLPDAKVGRLGQVNQVTFSGMEESSFVEDYGLDAPIPYSDITEAARARAEKRSSFDPRAVAVEGLTEYIELNREARCAAVVQNPDNFAPGRSLVLSEGDRFDNPSADAYTVIDEGFDKTLIYRPNTIVMGQAVWSKLKRNLSIMRALRGQIGPEGAVTRQQFAELFEIKPENLLIGEAFLNVARPGQPANLQRVWGTSIQLLYLNAGKTSSTDGTLTWGFTAEYGNRISGSIVDEDIGLEGGERTRVGEKVRELVVAKDVGYQILDAVS